MIKANPELVEQLKKDVLQHQGIDAVVEFISVYSVDLHAPYSREVCSDCAQIDVFIEDAERTKSMIAKKFYNAFS